MIKLTLLMLLILGIAASSQAQQDLSSQNVIIVTFDGLRWQEVFSGANKKLLSDPKSVSDTESLKGKYWSRDFEERRKKLMPFMWNTVAEQGQIYGNRFYRNRVNLTNKYWFSYPGYNEILTGIKNDKSIYFNWKRNNPNETILEYLNAIPEFTHKIAAVGSWDLFPYILNVQRSGIFVNSGNELIEHKYLSKQEEELNYIEEQVPAPRKADRPDIFTYRYAMEYLTLYSPRVMFISYGETDDDAHAGKYDKYLDAIHHIDEYIGGLWKFIQSDDHYRDRTTLIITTDHGRGFLFRNSWQRHGRKSPGSGQTWFAVIGPDTSPKGEIKASGQLFQNQLAHTMAAFLNVNYNLYKEEGAVISQVIQRKRPSDENNKPKTLGMLDK